MNTHCIYNSIKYIYNIGIKIYIKEEKVIISFGKKINDFLFKIQKVDFINLIFNYIKQRELFNGVLISINWIRNIYPYYNKNEKNYINNNYSHYNINYNSSSGINYFDIFLFVICIIIIIYLCYFFSQKKMKEKNQLKKKTIMMKYIIIYVS